MPCTCIFILDSAPMRLSLRLSLRPRQRNIVLELQRSLGVALARRKRDSQFVLDGEDGVDGEVLAVLVEDLGGEGLVAFGLDLLGGALEPGFPLPPFRLLLVQS